MSRKNFFLVCGLKLLIGQSRCVECELSLEGWHGKILLEAKSSMECELSLEGLRTDVGVGFFVAMQSFDYIRNLDNGITSALFLQDMLHIF